MALTTAIAANLAAADSSPILLNGPTEFLADDLSDGESVVITRERVDGTYETALTGAGPVVLTKASPSCIYVGYSNVVVSKLATDNAVAVGYASAV